DAVLGFAVGFAWPSACREPDHVAAFEEQLREHITGADFEPACRAAAPEEQRDVREVDDVESPLQRHDLNLLRVIVAAPSSYLPRAIYTRSFIDLNHISRSGNHAEVGNPRQMIRSTRIGTPSLGCNAALPTGRIAPGTRVQVTRRRSCASTTFNSWVANA